MLYTLSHSPYTSDLTALLRTVQQGDCLLLLSDGVMAGLPKSPAYLAISSTTTILTLYALSNDIAARGLTNHLAHKIQIISYQQFVHLTERQVQQISW